jgi:N-acetylneuraminate synthase
MTQEMHINGRPIGPNHPPYIIAEMSGNHNQSIERAFDIIDAAAETGADAIKLQTYTSDTMTIEHDSDLFKINDPKSLWNGYTLYDLYKVAHTPWEWHEKLFQRAKEKNITIFSTPFDATAVDFLESIGNPAYKIASFENCDTPLIRKTAKTKKPLIISTGMASIEDLDLSVKEAKDNGADQLALLKCTSAYPASPSDANISTISHLAQLFKTLVGLSDHTLGIGVPLASIPFGACIIEKHFTLDRSEGGVDAAFSLEPSELKALVEESKRAWQSIGEVRYSRTDNEKGSLTFRRSLFVVKDVQAGETFSEENLRSIRPGNGLSPKYYDLVLGKTAKRDISKGTPFEWGLIE